MGHKSQDECVDIHIILYIIITKSEELFKHNSEAYIMTTCPCQMASIRMPITMHRNGEGCYIYPY